MLNFLQVECSLETKIDWLPILLQCKENVLTHVRPLFRALKGPQPDLGIGAGGDKTKLVDLAAEKAIVEIFLQHGVSFTLVSEESGIAEYGNHPGERYVTIDPVDGTTNFVRGLPFFCSSIAISDKPWLSEVHTAMVADLVQGSVYTAMKGKGSYCDEKRISTSSVSSLEEAVIGLDLNTFNVKEVGPQLLELMQRTKHTRHFGANALELCFVAEGLTDSFVDVRGKLRTTDAAAAFLILREAGGTVTGPDGRNFDVELNPKCTLKFVASGNKDIHNLIIDLIKSR